MADGRAPARWSRSATACRRSCGSTRSSRRTASAASTTASEFSRKALEAAVAKGEPGRPAPPASAFHVNEKDRAWVDSKTTPQPNGVALQPIKLTGARDKVAKKTYIRAPKYPQPAFDKAYAECKADKTWQTFETTTAGHDVMVDDPAWLTEILLKVS